LVLVTLINRERSLAGLDGAQAGGRWPGRKPKCNLNDTDIAAARALLRDPSIDVQDIANRLHVVPGTLDRHLLAAPASGRDDARG
jgi:DNA invertase Pin-like site-specific DNA recombinase